MLISVGTGINQVNVSARRAPVTATRKANHKLTQRKIRRITRTRKYKKLVAKISRYDHRIQKRNSKRGTAIDFIPPKEQAIAELTKSRNHKSYKESRNKKIKKANLTKISKKAAYKIGIKDGTNAARLNGKKQFTPSLKNNRSYKAGWIKADLKLNPKKQANRDFKMYQKNPTTSASA